ncbi:hypothetical protein [Companilactobacillus versmoldensis]|uniref:hypothetical protein n=1 Tax=Companilactobacillus versmoldensis TaxID=194326 RepID=UPI000249287F|nr:hypothetical protein [Companilactobacillus versmoldensis]
MLKESKELIRNYDKHFLRKYRWRYHLLIVDNHLFDCYSFFLQAHREKDKLLHSYDLLEIPHKEELYRQVLIDLKKHTQMSIEYRDTKHLVHPGSDIVHDLSHGHYGSSKYHHGHIEK